MDEGFCKLYMNVTLLKCIEKRVMERWNIHTHIYHRISEVFEDVIALSNLSHKNMCIGISVRGLRTLYFNVIMCL